jgi:hypothetical protein
MKRSVVALGVIALLHSPALAQELVLGAVQIKLDALEAPVIAELRKQFSVRGIKGGWEVRSRDANDRQTPLVGVGTSNGRIRDVSFLWSPGFTATLEDVAQQLSHALPADDHCQVQNVTHPFEGGTVRRLIFRCGRVTVRVETGVWPRGNTASVRVSAE